ncbi:MAG: hypothetical protein ACO3IB_10815, partial [Phycisphaerales bacterium]
AIEEKLGADAAASFTEAMASARGGMGGGMGGNMGRNMSLGKLTKKSFDGDRAVFTSDDGTEIVFIVRSGSWKIDMTAAMPAEELEQMQQMVPMLSMMLAPVKQAAEKVAARIRSGELTTVEEIVAALSQAGPGRGAGRGQGG